MVKRLPEPTKRPRERAFLVGVEIYGQNGLLSISDSLRELALLAETAGLDVVGEASQKLDHPNPQTFIGPGKVEEVQALVEETQADVLLFDEELSPRHLRELENLFRKVRILDRTALILDIFAQHASTREGALQVELAQYEYRLPRLTRAWTHLARQSGGGGGRAGSVGGVGLRGPGETQLEVDRRDIRRRIAHLKGELEKVRTHRQQYRSRRKRSRIPVVTLVGYTNAGKSTLLNQLSEADVYVADQLFATLDPTTRRVELPGGHLALFTDTVGFIQKLPTQLVAAFRATLEEIAEADLLLHIVDITHPNARAQAEAVQQTLEEIQADHVPVLTVVNKIDRLGDPEKARAALASFPKAVAISALKGQGIKDLLKMVGQELYETYTPVTVRLPYKEGGLISLFHEMGQVEHSEHVRGGVFITGRLPGRLVAQFKPFTRAGDGAGDEILFEDEHSLQDAGQAESYQQEGFMQKNDLQDPEEEAFEDEELLDDELDPDELDDELEDELDEDLDEVLEEDLLEEDLEVEPEPIGLAFDDEEEFDEDEDVLDDELEDLEEELDDEDDFEDLDDEDFEDFDDDFEEDFDDD